MEARLLIYVSSIALAVSVFFMLLLRSAAGVLGLIDRPGGHKTHDGEVPVIGGIAMFMGLVVAALFGATIGSHGYTALAVAGLMVLVGGLDDRFNLPALTRLFAHLLAAIFLVRGTGFVVRDLGDLFGMGLVELSFLGPIFTIVACVALINAFNMLDGLDGLAGGCALIGCAALAVIAATAGARTSALVSACMAGAVLGFMIFNVPVIQNRPLRSFMGDAGSTLLGFIIAALALTLVQKDRADISPVLILWVVAIPIFELFATTIRRLFRRCSPLEPDNGHFHHVLRRAGLSVRGVFIAYFVASALAASFAVWAHQAGVQDEILFLGFVLGFACWMAFVHRVHRISALFPRLFGGVADSRVG